MVRYFMDTNFNFIRSHVSPANFNELCKAIQNYMPNLHDCTFVGYLPIQTVDRLWTMPMDLVRALPVSLCHLTLRLGHIFGYPLDELVSLCRRFEKLKSVNLVFTTQFELTREFKQSLVERQCAELQERGILYFGDAPSCEQCGCNS